jgi:hypothetical protein
VKFTEIEEKVTRFASSFKNFLNFSPSNSISSALHVHPNRTASALVELYCIYARFQRLILL